MEALFFLQNVIGGTATGDPFDANLNFSKFNQAIAVRKVGPFNNDKNSLYFFAYSPLIKLTDNNGTKVPFKDANGNFEDDGKLAFSLNATFDETDRIPETNSPPSEYFVPDSCAKCHGNSRIRAKLNYLDTDHWFDRVTPHYGLNDPKYTEEDFTALANSPYALLYDSTSKDPETEPFKTAFGVIRNLNEEMRDQNSRLDTGSSGANNFQLAAVTKWLDLHKPEANGAKHVPPYERGFGAEPWDSSKETHKKLLYYLNRYCYRCHSSVKYNVFDRIAVKSLAGQDELQSRVQEIDDPERWMPQDRIFPGLKVNMGAGEATGDLKEFLELVEILKQEQ